MLPVPDHLKEGYARFQEQALIPGTPEYKLRQEALQFLTEELPLLARGKRMPKGKRKPLPPPLTLD